MSLPLHALALALCWLTACGAEPSRLADGMDSGDGSGAIVEIGTGTSSFEPLVDEQAMPLHEGIQGGHHFLVHARMRGLVPGNPATPGLASNPATSLRAFDERGNRVDDATPTYFIGYRDAGDGFYELPNPRFVVVQNARVVDLIGQRVRLQVEATDHDGRTAMDEVWVMVYEQPLEPGDAGVADPSADRASPDG